MWSHFRYNVLRIIHASSVSPSSTLDKVNRVINLVNPNAIVSLKSTKNRSVSVYRILSYLNSLFKGKTKCYR